jgi:hypothetical protein
MTCDFYRQHEMGEIDDPVFDRHVLNCTDCQNLVTQDAQLLAQAKRLKQPLAAPLLWAKIENTLRAEQRHGRGDWLEAFHANKLAILRLAAMVILAVGAGAYFFSRPEPREPRLLAGAALQKVEEKEREHAAAIAELERLAQPQLTKLDVDLMLLYRDRLETIDAQIARCKEALASNPANAHIRRYLLAALQDKQQTLQELVASRSL